MPRDTLRPLDEDAPRWGLRVMLALGVLSILALPVLTGAFALRVDDAFGMHYAPVDVETRDTPNGTFMFVRVDALKAEDEQDFWFDEGTAVLHAGDATVTAASVTARSCQPARVACARTVTMIFAGAPEAGWRVDAHLSWLSRDVRVTSAHDVTFTGEGRTFA